MFTQHRLGSQTLSTKNLVLLFLTIAFGFAAVVTLAAVHITSNVNNVRQTLSQLRITASGTEAPSIIEISSGGIMIDEDILEERSPFIGKILGVDENGNVIYAESQNIGTGDGSGDNLGNHIAEQNIVMGAHLIANNESVDAGIGFSTTNDLIVKQRIITHQTLSIKNDGTGGCSSTNSGEIRYLNKCFQGCDGHGRKDMGGIGCILSNP